MEKTIIVLSQSPATPIFYTIYLFIGLVVVMSIAYFSYKMVINALKHASLEEEKENMILSQVGFTDEYIKKNYRELLPELIDNMELRIMDYKKEENIKFDQNRHKVIESIEWQFLSLCKHLSQPDTWQYIFKKLLLINIKMENDLTTA